MPVYAYEAVTQSGERVTDELTAPSVSAAIAELEARGLVIRLIRALAEQPERAAEVEVPSFYRRIEAALESREALSAALEAFADEMSSKRSASELRALVAELRRGATAQDFLRHESAAAWLPLILRSPTSTVSAEGFEQLVSEATRESDNRRLRRRMLFYPVTVLVIALLLGLLLLYAVVPTFGQMYREFGLDVPQTTRLLVQLSEQLHYSPSRFLFTLLLIALAVYGLIRTWTTHALTTRLFGSFVAGNSASVTAMARFTGTLGELLAFDAPLPDAIRIAGRASQHRYYRAMADELAADARQGNGRLEHSAVAKVFPANVIYALAGGRDGGPNIPLLRELSNLYADRIAQRFDWSSGIIGPLALVAIGVVVAVVIIALLMPLISAFSGVTLI